MNIKKKLQNLGPSFKSNIQWLGYLLSYSFFLVIYILIKVINWFALLRFTPKPLRTILNYIQIKIHNAAILFDRRRSEERFLTRFAIIDLAFKGLMFKKSRSIITIMGMSVGIAVIVFLVSIGYGLQDLVISRAINLNEMRQTDVSIQPGTNLRITDETIAEFSDFAEAESILPVIALVGRVSFEDSVSDVAVYGVTREYLEQKAIKPSFGEVFASNDLSVTHESIEGESEQNSDVDENDVLSNIDIIELDEETEEENRVEIVEVNQDRVRQAVVNVSMLELLGINPNEAVGKEFTVSFVLTGEVLEDFGRKVESEEIVYSIVGVIDQNGSPFFYVPFVDLRALGIVNYTQLRLVAKENDLLPSLRTKVESLGYITSSVADTKVQIDSFFQTTRQILAVVGSFALAVASLGMFNTLTVSLLERTREVGLMKALGMVSKEVRALFLVESILMGVSGGVLGVVLGAVLGHLLSLGLSLIAASQEASYIDVSYVPVSLILLILSISFLVGLLTGIYPARRASKISALNALRYE